jgi:hypothetical protein
VLAFLLAAPYDVVRGADEAAAAEAAAKANAATADGQKFADSIGAKFGREQGRTVQECAKQSKPPDVSDFDVFVRLDGTGAVDQTVVKPPTTLAKCVGDKMLGWKTLAPPRDGYWVKVGVNLTRK